MISAIQHICNMSKSSFKTFINKTMYTHGKIAFEIRHPMTTFTCFLSKVKAYTLNSYFSNNNAVIWIAVPQKYLYYAFCPWLQHVAGLAISIRGCRVLGGSKLFGSYNACPTVSFALTAFSLIFQFSTRPICYLLHISAKGNSAVRVQSWYIFCLFMCFPYCLQNTFTSFHLAKILKMRNFWKYTVHTGKFAFKIYAQTKLSSAYAS